MVILGLLHCLTIPAQMVCRIQVAGTMLGIREQQQQLGQAIRLVIHNITTLEMIQVMVMGDGMILPHRLITMKDHWDLSMKEIITVVGHITTPIMEAATLMPEAEFQLITTRRVVDILILLLIDRYLNTDPMLILRLHTMLITGATIPMQPSSGRNNMEMRGHHHQVSTLQGDHLVTTSKPPIGTLLWIGARTSGGHRRHHRGLADNNTLLWVAAITAVAEMLYHSDILLVPAIKLFVLAASSNFFPF